jgi:hypothetical protein
MAASLCFKSTSYLIQIVVETNLGIKSDQTEKGQKSVTYYLNGPLWSKYKMAMVSFMSYTKNILLQKREFFSHRQRLYF